MVYKKVDLTISAKFCTASTKGGDYSWVRLVWSYRHQSPLIMQKPWQKCYLFAYLHAKTMKDHQFIRQWLKVLKLTWIPLAFFRNPFHEGNNFIILADGYVFTDLTLKNSFKTTPISELLQNRYLMLWNPKKLWIKLSKNTLFL